MSEKRVVLLVGTGRVGAEFAKAIVERGCFSLRVLVRATTSEAKVEAMRGMGAEVVVGSTSDPDSLRKACHGVTTVVSAIHGFADPEGQLFLPQVALMRAARDMGVEQFIPSEYGTVARDGVPEGIPVCEAKRRVGEAAAELAKESGGRFHYTLLRAGGFVELFFTPVLGLDLAGGKATLWGGGEQIIALTAIPDLAKYVAAAVANPTVYDRALDVGSFKTTWNDFLAAVEARYGRKIEANRLLQVDLKAEYEALPPGETKQRSSIGMRLAMASGCGGLLDFEGGSKLLPEVRPTTMEEVLERLPELAAATMGGAAAMAAAPAPAATRP